MIAIAMDIGGTRIKLGLVRNNELLCTANTEAESSNGLREKLPVIENLVKNAIDAMRGRGELTVSVEEDDKYVNIKVTDTGKGIPKNQFKSIFEPGFTTKKRGWGLGLSLSKRIIDQYHKGHLFVKSSEAGKGTTFRIVMNK